MTASEYGKAIHEILKRPDLQPRNGNTYCNVFVTEIARLFGYTGFDGLMANQIVTVAQTSKLFSEVFTPYTELAKQASQKALFIVAGQQSREHGHVCVVSPLGGITVSGKWKKTVCNVANVGKDVFENKGLNWAFATEPTLYIYQG